MTFDIVPLLIYIVAFGLTYLVLKIILYLFNKPKDDEMSHVFGEKVKGKFE